ncbi:MAG: hypothetical protein ACFE8U_01595 [Candidatus Hermodarchaeota archaeon]
MSETTLILEKEVKTWKQRLNEIGDRTSVPIISILMAFILGIITLYFLGYDPFFAIYQMTFGTITLENLPDILFYSTPLLFTGLSVAVAFRAGMFNIGTEGQLYFGAFLSALVGFGLKRYFNFDLQIIFSSIFGPDIGLILASVIMIPLLMIVAALGGAFWALVPALLKARGVHEVITTIMMNYVALFLMIFFVGDLTSPFIETYGGGNFSPQTPAIVPAAKVPTIFDKAQYDLHWGFVFGLIACVIIFIVLWKTKIGYEARAVGHNPNAAKYGGISVPRTYIYIMLISGALGGLAGGFEIMGFFYRFISGFSPGYGFDGISVAIIGGNHPFGVIFGAILFGWLKDAGTTLQVNGIPRDVADTLKGVIVFFVAIPLLAKSIINYLNKSTQGTWIKTESKRFFKEIYDIRVSILQTISVVIILSFYLLLYSQAVTLINIVVENLSTPFFEIFLNQIYYHIYPFSTRYPVIKPVVGTIFFVMTIVGYFWFKKKGFWNTGIRYSFLLTGMVLGAIEFIYLIELLGQDPVLFGLLVLIGITILYYEWLGREKRVKDEDIGEFVVSSYKKPIMVYSIATAIFLSLNVLLTILGPTAFPLINLFLFTIDDLGTVIGLAGIIILIFCFVMLKRVTLPRDQSQVYFLPYIFYVLVIIFGLQTLSFVYETDPFLLISMTLSIAAPIGLASLGGMFSEKSGVVNIGLEGMMLTGAFVSVWFCSLTQDPWIGVIGAVVAGALIGFLHAIASIKYRADQVVVGVAINIVAAALTTLGLFVVWGIRGTSPSVVGIPNIKLPFLQDIPLMGQLLYDLAGGTSGIDPMVYIFIVLIFVSAWIIQRTSFGLRVRAVGEHPRAADTLGINVYSIRYICVTLSGIFASIGGAALTVGDSPIFRQNMSSGRGFVALAALIFGGWSPIGAALASLLFGFAYAFRFQLEAAGVGWIVLGIHLEKLTPTLPYLITIIAVAAIAKRMKPPAADGIPYVKEGG